MVFYFPVFRRANFCLQFQFKMIFFWGGETTCMKGPDQLNGNVQTTAKI